MDLISLIPSIITLLIAGLGGLVSYTKLKVKAETMSTDVDELKKELKVLKNNHDKELSEIKIALKAIEVHIIEIKERMDRDGKR